MDDTDRCAEYVARMLAADLKSEAALATLLATWPFRDRFMFDANKRVIAKVFGAMFSAEGQQIPSNRNGSAFDIALDKARAFLVRAINDIAVAADTPLWDALLQSVPEDAFAAKVDKHDLVWEHNSRRLVIDLLQLSPAARSSLVRFVGDRHPGSVRMAKVFGAKSLACELPNSEALRFVAAVEELVFPCSQGKFAARFHRHCLSDPSYYDSSRCHLSNLVFHVRGRPEDARLLLRFTEMVGMWTAYHSPHDAALIKIAVEYVTNAILSGNRADVVFHLGTDFDAALGVLNRAAASIQDRRLPLLYQSFQETVTSFVLQGDELYPGNGSSVCAAVRRACNLAPEWSSMDVANSINALLVGENAHLRAENRRLERQLEQSREVRERLANRCLYAPRRA
jgi:hypothetical protein